MPHKFFTTDLIKIHYTENGDPNNPAMLLLHGNGERLQSFAALIPDLAQHFHLYAIDFRGHGHSEKISGSYFVKTHMEDVANFIDGCIQKPSIVLGHSLGGMVALMLAAKYPKKVQSIILGDTPLSKEVLRDLVQNQSEMIHHIVELVKTKKLDQLHQMLGDKAMAENISQCDPSIFEMMFGELDKVIDRFDVPLLASKIKCPVLVQRGLSSKGSLVTDQDLENFRNTLNVPCTVNSFNTGHDLYREDKESAINAISSFTQ